MKDTDYHFIYNYKGRKRDLKYLQKRLNISELKAELILDCFIHTFLGYSKKLRQLFKNDKSRIYLKKHLEMNFYSKLLEDLFGNYKLPYTEIIDALLDAGLMTRVRGYYYHHKLKYGLSNRYKLNIRTIHAVGKRHNPYIAKLHKNAKKKKTEISKKIIQHQADVLNDPESFISIPMDKWDDLTDREKEIIREINECDYTPDDFKEKQGRIYHPFQQLPKWVRKYMVIEGQQAASLDVKNSQGTILGWVVEDYYANQLGIDMPEDVTKWVELAENGVLWDYIRDLLQLPDRDAAKTHFNVAVLGKRKETEEGNLIDKGRYIRAQLKKKFPMIFHWVNITKRSGSYKDIHTILTRVEANYMKKVQEFMIDQGMSFINIHDEILLNPRYKEVIKEYMESFGFAVNEPKIEYRYEDWHSPIQIDFERERRVKLAERLKEIERRKRERERRVKEHKRQIPEPVKRLFGVAA